MRIHKVHANANNEENANDTDSKSVGLRNVIASSVNLYDHLAHKAVRFFNRYQSADNNNYSHAGD